MNAGYKSVFFFFLIFSFMMLACTSKNQFKEKTADGAVSEVDILPVIEVNNILDNRYSFSVNDVVYEYIIDFPAVVENSPLVIMVHGMNNTGESMRNDTGFHKAANSRGYTVVYVTAAKFQKTGLGWNSGISSEGNDDVLFFKSLASYLENEYLLDKKRTFAIGFSNGGFMMHRLAMEAEDVFEACVGVAAKMPGRIWKNRNETNSIGFFQVTGEKDNVIPKNYDNSAQYSIDPAIEDVMEYWAESNGLNQSLQTEIGDGSLLIKYMNEKGIFDTPKNIQVWHLGIKDGRHAWPAVQFTQIDINALILEFFELWN